MSRRKDRPAATGEGGTATLRRRLAPVFVLLVVLLLLTGLVAAANAVVSYRAVVHLTSELRPAAAANNAVLQDMTDAETGVRGWGVSGERRALEPYRKAVDRLPGHQATLREYADDYPELARLVEEQERAAAAWFEEYGALRVRRPGGPGSFEPALFDVGKARFDAVRDAHAGIEEVLSRQTSQERQEAVRRTRRVGLVAGLFALLGLVVAAVARRRVQRGVAEPLEDLAEVVRAQTRGRHEVRAEVRGVQEIQVVGAALNELADQHDRARAVEAEVQEEIRSLDRARRDFVSNVSHELRTPLTSIAGYLELLEDGLGDRIEAPYDEMFDATQRNVTRLTTLVQDLLTLSRAEDRSTDLEQLDLRAIVEDAVSDLRMTAARRDVTLALDAPRERLPVLADQGQINRVFLNLVSNAVKFSHEGGRVEVTISRRDGDHVVTVSDHGIGIPERDLSSIGERFFRASNAVAGEVPGTGLGLRIVQTIVGNHGGDLRLDSVEGEGTTVTVTLPVHGE